MNHVKGCSVFLLKGETRRQRVMIDRDLAVLYGVETKYLNRQVKRNIERFPGQFMFRLTKDEKEQLVTNWHRFNSLWHHQKSPSPVPNFANLRLHINLVRGKRRIGFPF